MTLRDLLPVVLSMSSLSGQVLHCGFLPPFDTPPGPTGTNSFEFATLNDPPLTVLDLINPIPSRVCAGFGPSNAVGVVLATSNGKSTRIKVDDNSCVDLFLPQVQVHPSCIAAMHICNPIEKPWSCRETPNEIHHDIHFMNRGWYFASPNPSQTVLKGGGKAIVNAMHDPEQPAPLAFLVASESLLTVNICGPALPAIHLSFDPLGQTDDKQVLLGGCKFVQANAIFVVPEEVPSQVAVFTWTTTWSSANRRTKN